MKKIKIAHIVHPAIVAPTSDLVIAQPITFETMHIAKAYVHDKVDIELYAVQFFDEERVPIPAGFIRTRDLTRSVSDIGFFQTKKKFALIKDMLDILFESSDADYLIYTNVDIALQPYFYRVTADIIRQGYDAFIINRRSIPGYYASIEEIPLMYAEIGEKHPGWDCFIFKRDLYPRFELGNACIGADWIGRIILTNLISLSQKFTIFTDLQMTFHIGDRRVWQSDEFSDYAEHNKEECRKILVKFDKEYGPFDRKGLPGRFLSKFE
ncbi:MAG: hypothetical protein MUF15_22730 [Acidobacteria bacterium]|jgi:hypothetical protein|nr:hypothetical protein [Acidobacteriota bacterium]